VTGLLIAHGLKQVCFPQRIPVHTNEVPIGWDRLFYLRIRAFRLTLPTPRMEHGNTLVAATAGSPAPSRASGEAEGDAE